jgi:hypothetical protein
MVGSHIGKLDIKQALLAWLLPDGKQVLKQSQCQLIEHMTAKILAFRKR